MKLFVLCIDHWRGRNITVHPSMEAALGEAAIFARQWWHEAFPYNSTPPEDDERAVDLYFDKRLDDETYQINECEMDVESPQAGARDPDAG